VGCGGGVPPPTKIIFPKMMFGFILTQFLTQTVQKLCDTDLTVQSGNAAYKTVLNDPKTHGQTKRAVAQSPPEYATANDY